MPPTSSHGATFPLVVENAEHRRLLDEIPSETTRAERHLLFHFFSSIWDGKSGVLEVGPFLGGTTRSIALGMLNNPQLIPGSLLYTYDRFDTYYKGSDLAAYLEPLFVKGVLNPQDKKQIMETASFEEVFHRIHQGHEYHSLIKCANGPLPDAPEETEKIPSIFQPPENMPLGAVFIDGCKSWYGTRFFMEKVSSSCEPGSWFIAQDYSQYTCFWLPVFFEVFHDSFKLQIYADSTYCFQLTKKLDPEEIKRRYPIKPECIGAGGLEVIFNRLLQGACDRDDMRSRTVYTIQWAAALAYIGETKEARKKFDGLERASWKLGTDEFIKKARHCPTYRASMTGAEEIILG